MALRIFKPSKKSAENGSKKGLRLFTPYVVMNSDVKNIRLIESLLKATGVFIQVHQGPEGRSRLYAHHYVLKEDNANGGVWFRYDERDNTASINLSKPTLKDINKILDNK